MDPNSRLSKKIERRYERRGNCNCKSNANTQFSPVAIQAIQNMLRK